MTQSLSTNVNALLSRRFLNTNDAALRRSQEQLASGKIVSDPSSNPSAAAIGYTLSSTIDALGQASSTVEQSKSLIQLATGALGSSNDILARMNTLAAQASSDTIGDEERGMLDKEFQSLLNQIDTNAQITWGKTQLFTGGVGTANAIGAANQSASLTAVTNAFTNGFSNQATYNSGLISGSVNSISVTKNAGVYDVRMKVGDQTFAGTTTPTANGTLTLTSTTDTNNRLQFSYDTTVTAITNETTFRSSLEQLLGVNVGAPVSFQSYSTALTNVNVTAGAGSKVGMYGLSYTTSGTTGTFRLTNGTDVYTATTSSGVNGASASFNDTIVFTDGTKLALSGFNGGASATGNMAVYQFTQGTALNMTFQIGQKSTDTMALTFNGVTSTALGMNGLNIQNKNNAQNATNQILSAMGTINNQIAILGGKKSQLDYTGRNLEVSIQNQSAAKSTFTDADVTKALMDSQQADSLVATASVSFQKALEGTSKLSQLVQSVLR